MLEFKSRPTLTTPNLSLKDSTIILLTMGTHGRKWPMSRHNIERDTQDGLPKMKRSVALKRNTPSRHAGLPAHKSIMMPLSLLGNVHIGKPSILLRRSLLSPTVSDRKLAFPSGSARKLSYLL